MPRTASTSLATSSGSPWRVRSHYESVLEVARSLREQIDRDDIWRRTSQSPYARAFFYLAEELGILEERRATT